MPQPASQVIKRTTPRIRRHGPEAVEAIHDAAMAGNEMARILDVAMALEGGFAEVPDLARNRGDDRQSMMVLRRLKGWIQPSRWAAMPREIPRGPRQAPPIKPDQVFFGLTRGQSFGPPNARPTK